MNAVSNYFQFFGINFGVAGSKVTGAQAATVLIAEQFIGTSPFGQIQVAPSAGDADAVLSSVAGQSSALLLQRAGSQRWAIQKNNATEIGSNAGSDFIITRYADGGGSIDNPLSIARATGIVTLNDGQASVRHAPGVI